MAQVKRTQRVALVTGAGRRIGRAIAIGLAEDGWDVAVHFRRSKKDAETLAGELSARGVKAAAFGCNLEDAEALKELLPECGRRLGPVGCLVNNAAMFEYDSIENLDESRWEQHMNVNLRAPLLLARDFSKQLPEGVVGCVVNMLDQKVFNLNPDFLSYTIAKIGLEGVTRVLAMALAPRVRVCGIAPGITLVSGEQNEEGFERAHRFAPLGRSSDMEDVVNAVRFVVNAKSLTGETIVVDGGQHLWPRPRDVQFEMAKG
jgi:NAD(P)-dependent dehydrogenase (short-subunit alcohol dehydrogenase family)